MKKHLYTALMGLVLNSCFEQNLTGSVIVDNVLSKNRIEGQITERRFQTDSGRIYLQKDTMILSQATGEDGHFYFDSLPAGNWNLYWQNSEEGAQHKGLILDSNTPLVQLTAQNNPWARVSLNSNVKKLHLNGLELEKDPSGQWLVPILPLDTVDLDAEENDKKTVIKICLKDNQVQLNSNLGSSQTNFNFPIYDSTTKPWVHWHIRQVQKPGELKDLSGNSHPLYYSPNDSTYLGMSALSERQVYFAGDSILPRVLNSGITKIQVHTFKKPLKNKAFTIFANEGMRMTIYWKNDSLYWYKNNDDLWQSLIVPFQWPSDSTLNLAFSWGDGMSIFSNGKKLASNNITTPFQLSTRNWGTENRFYVGKYPAGTVVVDGALYTANPLQAYFIQAAIWGTKPDGSSTTNNSSSSSTLSSSSARTDTISTINPNDYGYSYWNLQNLNTSNCVANLGSTATSICKNSDQSWTSPINFIPNGLSDGIMHLVLSLDSLPKPGNTLAFFADAGLRMSVFLKNDTLTWFKNNANLVQKLSAKVNAKAGDTLDLNMYWGHNGMQIKNHNQVIASNANLTSPFQLSGRIGYNEDIFKINQLPTSTVSYAYPYSQTEKLKGQYIHLSFH